MASSPNTTQVLPECSISHSDLDTLAFTHAAIASQLGSPCAWTPSAMPLADPGGSHSMCHFSFAGPCSFIGSCEIPLEELWQAGIRWQRVREDWETKHASRSTRLMGFASPTLTAPQDSSLMRWKVPGL